MFVDKSIIDKPNKTFANRTKMFYTLGQFNVSKLIFSAM